jgi:hypothetical protein
MEGKLAGASAYGRIRLAATLAGVGLLALALVLRRDPASAGIGLAPVLSALAVFAVMSVLPGYSVLRLAGLARGGWIDWLGPAFAVSMTMHCLWIVPGYLLRFGLAGTGVCVAGVTAVLFAAAVLLRGHPPDDGETFFPAREAGGWCWRDAFTLFTLLAMAQAAFLSLRALDPTVDLWFHAAGTTQMVKTGFLELADPFHDTAAPLPMYLMSSWQALLAVVCRFAGVEAVDAVRIVPIALVPVAVSAFAVLVRTFTREPRERLLALGLFVLYYGCLATSMEASFERSMWREFSGPRWVALFCLYPVTLALGIRWLLEGGWLRALSAAAINGAALFVHPQGGQYYAYVLLFFLAGGLLLRQQRRSLGRALLALVLVGAALLPFLTCRLHLLKGLVGSSVAVEMVSVARDGAAGPVDGRSPEDQADDEGSPARSARSARPVFFDFSPAAAVRFGRAATLLCSPMFFLGLAGLALWWKSGARDDRRRLLLLSMGPALVLPLLPAVHLLPVGIFPNLLYRSVWAAPVLIATAVGLVSAARGPGADDAAHSPWPGRLWLVVAGAVIVSAHLRPPYRFESWWQDASLFSLLCLAGLFLALRFPGGPTTVVWKRLWALPAAAVLAASCVIAAFPKGRVQTTERFVAIRRSPAVAYLRGVEAGGGYVLTDATTGNMLTALTGARVLGAGKTAITNYTEEYRRLDAVRKGLLAPGLADADFLAGCRAARVERVLVPKKSQPELLERMAGLGPGAGLLCEDGEFALYGLPGAEPNAPGQAGAGR